MKLCSTLRVLTIIPLMITLGFVCDIITNEEHLFNILQTTTRVVYNITTFVMNIFLLFAYIATIILIRVSSILFVYAYIMGCLCFMYVMICYIVTCEI